MFTNRKKGFAVTLWIVQSILAALFLFAGSMKLVLPVEQMTRQMPLPGVFLRFIGIAEVLGALGLVLPMLANIKPALTPMAAAGLLIIMIGATVVSWMVGGVAAAMFPLIVGMLLVALAYNRRSLLVSAA